MPRTVKIKDLTAPQGDLATFDPGAYLASLEFYETNDSISESDRFGLAQFIHYLAFLALQNRSAAWPGSVIPSTSTAFQAIETHFAQLDDWSKIAAEDGMTYRGLVSLLMPVYPPQRPTG